MKKVIINLLFIFIVIILLNVRIDGANYSANNLFIARVSLFILTSFYASFVANEYKMLNYKQIIFIVLIDIIVCMTFVKPEIVRYYFITNKYLQTLVLFTGFYFLSIVFNKITNKKIEK